MQLLELAREVLSAPVVDNRVVRLSTDDRVIFVGDIHGDLEAFERVGTMSAGAVVVFLGDLVDRGPASREVLARALAAKLERPRSVHLLMGNHEAWGQARFQPADFWESLAPRETDLVAAALLRLPLAAWHPAGVLALHGALPDVATLDEVSCVPLGGPAWRDITWGDWEPHRGARASYASRPLYSEQEFVSRSRRLGVRALVRSHQPDAPPYLFDDRCLTLFTSSAYGNERSVAVLPAGRSVQTARDLDLVTL